MRRSDLGLLAVAPLVLYAAAVAAADARPWDLVAVLGLAAAALPFVGRRYPDLAVLGWIPGLFLAVLLFAVSGITVNPLPGPLGDLAGGWAVGSPLFAAAALAAAAESPGRRLLATPIVLLSSGAVLAVAAAGGAPGVAGFADLFVQLPKEQALALASILSGGSSAGAPFLAVPLVPFAFLALLAGAGILVSLVAVDPTGGAEGLGHEGPVPYVPEGQYRSLLAEGRARLGEATPPDLPDAIDPGAVVSLVAATATGLGVLAAAEYEPGYLVAGLAAVTVGLLAAVLFAVRLPGRREEPTAALGPTGAGAGPARRESV